MASEMSRRVGANIRKRRLELGLKRQRDLAARFKSDAVDAQRISDWERGVNQPSERYQEELLLALELKDVSALYEPEPGTPDLLETFSGKRLQTQIDDIQRKLEEVLVRLPAGAAARAKPSRAARPLAKTARKRQ